MAEIISLRWEKGKEIPKFEDFLQDIDLYRGKELPPTVILKGTEVPLMQLAYSDVSFEEKKQVRLAMLRSSGTPELPPPIPLVVKDFEYYQGVEEDDPVIHYSNGRPWYMASIPLERLSGLQISELSLAYEQYWDHAIYAGRHWFTQTAGKKGESHKVGDIKVWISRREYTEEMKANERLAALFPLVKPEGSYVKQTMYENEQYSLYAQHVHGPIAKEIVGQWPGHMTVPADGSGLMASVGPEEGEYTDIQLGPWVHKRVKQKTIKDTLRDTPPGSLQVLIFCTAFMDEADMLLVRPPYVIVDKYQPPIASQYATATSWSSELFRLSQPEDVTYSDPTYTNNLLGLGDVDFYSEQIHSIYAKRLGVRKKGGKMVTQTWQELLKHREDYNAMVGMVPIIEKWPPKRIFTRVIYHTRGIVPEKVSSTQDGADTYFFFQKAGIIKYPTLAQVKDFPTLELKDYVGSTRAQIEERIGERLLNGLVPSWRKMSIVFVDDTLTSYARFHPSPEVLDAIENGGNLSKQDRELLKICRRGRRWVSDVKKHPWEVRSLFEIVVSGESENVPSREMFELYGAGERKIEGKLTVWYLYVQIMINGEVHTVSPRARVTKSLFRGSTTFTVLDRDGVYKVRLNDEISRAQLLDD